jgi:hypothetical protein
MQLIRSLFSVVAVLLLLAPASAVYAQDGLRDALARLKQCCPAVNTLFGPSLVTADFNQDRHADGALLIRERSGFRIELHFRDRRAAEISFPSSKPALVMLALDVNQDGDPDLVIQDTFSRQWLFLFLNDGHGDFHAASLKAIAPEVNEEYLRIAQRGPDSDSEALLGPSKMRCRNSADYCNTDLAALYLHRVMRIPGYSTASADPVPNLVRGSPIPDSL